MTGFSDPILTGDGSLIRKAAKSPNYAAGTTGWSINADGSAEFNALTVRGTIIVQSSAQGIFLYSGTPALGNLVASIANGTGVDAYGNNFKAGLVSYKSGTSYIQIWNGLLQFHDNSYAFDPSINNHVGSTPSDPPSLQVASPAGSPPSGIPLYAEIDLNGISTDGTNGPSINLGGFNNVGAAVPVPVRINGQMFATDPVNAGIAETWHAVAYAAGWSVGTTPIQGASYRLTPSNNVEFKGGAANASAAAGQTMFTLPVGYRPPFVRTLVSWCRTTASTGGITVNTDGTVVLTAIPTGGHTMELDGLYYSLDS